MLDSSRPTEIMEDIMWGVLAGDHEQSSIISALMYPLVVRDDDGKTLFATVRVGVESRLQPPSRLLSIELKVSDKSRVRRERQSNPTYKEKVNHPRSVQMIPIMPYGSPGSGGSMSPGESWINSDSRFLYRHTGAAGRAWCYQGAVTAELCLRLDEALNHFLGLIETAKQQQEMRHCVLIMAQQSVELPALTKAICDCHMQACVCICEESSMSVPQFPNCTRTDSAPTSPVSWTSPG